MRTNRYIKLHYKVLYIYIQIGLIDLSVLICLVYFVMLIIFLCLLIDINIFVCLCS